MSSFDCGSESFMFCSAAKTSFPLMKKVGYLQLDNWPRTSSANHCAITLLSEF